LRYSQEFTGAYSWVQESYATFDLRTGRQLALVDLVANSPAQLTRRMHGAINRRFGEALAEMAADKTDSADIAMVAEHFCWDWPAKRVRFQGDSGPVGEERAAEPNLESFALTPHELRLYYGRMLPHSIQNYEPDNTYHFPYARIQPRGLLVPVAKAALAKKQ
jgi:hypothetical protein